MKQHHKSVFIETYGCSLNISDSELIAGYLRDADYEIAVDEDSADVIILNSCTVKGDTFSNFKKRLDQLKDKVVVIAGCIPKVYDGYDFLKKYSYIGTDNISKIAEIVKSAIEGQKIQNILPLNEKRLNLPKKRRNEVIEIIPIAKGCLGRCAYCQTRLARGELSSYAEEEIISQAESAISDNVKEIWITAQDTSIYGLDIGTNLSGLLKKITNIEHDFKVRLGMANPLYIKKQIADLLDVFKSEKMFKFIHIPLQSGSNKVLSDMNRMYKVEDFVAICETFRDKFPNISISTDIICGYPTETDDDFESTLDVLRKIRPSTVNRSRFSPREKTPAADLKQLNPKIISERSKELTELIKNIISEDNKKWIGWEGETLIDEVKKVGSVLSRNFAYKPIVINEDIPLGEKVKVKIYDTTIYHLKGKTLL